MREVAPDDGVRPKLADHRAGEWQNLTCAFRAPPCERGWMTDVTHAEEPQLGPSSGELLGAPYGKRRRRIIAVVVAILVLGVAGVVGASFVSAARAKREAERKLGALSQCLFGERVDEAPAPHLRRAQLAVMTLSDLERGIGDEAWPQRCGVHAQELLAASKSAGLTSADAKDLGYYPDKLALALKTPRGVMDDTSELIEGTWAEAKKAGLVPAAADVAGPPARVRETMTIDDLAKVTPFTKATFDLDKIVLDVHPGDERWFVVQDVNVDPPAILCKIGAEDLTCQKIPAPLAGPALRLLGTTEAGAAPLLFVGDRGAGGIHRADTGEKVDAIYTYGAHAAKGGAVHVLGWDASAQKAVLVYQARAGAPVTRTVVAPDDLEVDDYLHDAQLAYGHLFVRGRDKDGATKLMVRAIDDATGALAPPVFVSGLEKIARRDGREGRDERTGPPSISVCQHARSMIVQLKARGESHAVFFQDGKWQKTLVGDRIGIRGPGFVDKADFLCTPSGAILTIKGYQVRCFDARCDLYDLSHPVGALGSELNSRPNGSSVAALGDAVAWAVMAGARGGVRVRVATAPDRAEETIFDDLIADGKLGTESTVHALTLVSGNTRAVLFLSTKAGVYALRVDAAAKVTPEPIVWRLPT